MNSSTDKGSVLLQSISHYRIIQKLSAGGMGEVYLAEDTRLDRKIAIKLVTSELAADPIARKRLLREARAAAKLDHPNICAIYEVDEVEHQSYIVMQYVEGETLSARIQRQPLALWEVLDVAVQIVDALCDAHSHDIIHRDIKPQNVIISLRGQVKVLDFGLAKVSRLGNTNVPASEADTQSLLTEPGLVVGTVCYMSPEQLRGEQVDLRSDIFSFGALLYEMLSGRGPFMAENRADTISAVLTREPVPLSRYSPEAPQELQWITNKALRKNKEERYQTTKELLSDLSNLKRRLEFEAELERSKDPRPIVSTVSRDSQLKKAGTFEPVITRVGGEIMTRGAWSARYLMGLVERHKAMATLAVLALVLAAGVAYFAIPARAIDSLAILPLVNSGNDPNTDYLSDGITESLINSLSKLSNLKVIARSSVFRYKGRDLDAQAVGRELGVRALLTGRIVQRGDHLSISVELEDVRDNRHLWGEQYDQRLSNLLNVQEIISRQITENLRLKLTSKEQQVLSQRHTENVESYQLYLKGRYHSETWTQDGINEGIAYFNQALERDPNYALAYLALAEDYYLFSSQFWSPKDAMPKVKEAAAMALQKDQTLADAHTYTAIVRAFYEHDFSGAERDLQHAIELNPGSASAHQWYGYFLIAMRRWDDSLKELKRARELDPLSGPISSMLGMRVFSMREYDQAIVQFQRAIEIDPDFWWSHFFLGWAYQTRQMYEEGMGEFNKALQLGGSSWVSAYVGFVQAQRGKKPEAQKVLYDLEEQAKQRYISPHHLAIVYTGLGDKNRALDSLEKAYDLGEDTMVFLNVDPTWDSLRSEQRFKDLVRRVGLPQSE